MESTRVDLISLHQQNAPDLVLAVQNRQYEYLPIPSGCRLLSCEEAFETNELPRRNDNRLVIAVKILSVKPRIADIPVRVERTKLIVQNLVDNETVDMFVLGLYSANVARLGVLEGDLAFVSGATVTKTRIQPKQAHISEWSAYVGQELFKKKDPICKVRFVRSRDFLEAQQVDAELPAENISQNVAPSNRTIENDEQNLNVGDDSRITDPTDSSSKPRGANVSEVVPSVTDTYKKVPTENGISEVVDNDTLKVVPVDAVATKVGPIRNPQHDIQKVPKHPSAKVYTYTKLKHCSAHKSRYNTWAVIKELVELPARRKTKLVARLLITEESMDSWGDLRETYKFSMLANSMENIPPLADGSVLRIHHMVVEVFNGMADGRVYDARSVVVVEGGVGKDIKPISTKDDLGDLVWSASDEERVKELRRFYEELFVNDLKIEEIVKEVLCNLCCVVTKVIDVDDAIVLRVADGTEAKIYALVWKNGDSQGHADDNTGFVDVFVTHSEVVDMVLRGSVVVGSFLRLLGLRCKLHRKVDSQGLTMEYCDTPGNSVEGFEFILENTERRVAGVEVLHNGDGRVETIKERMGERAASNKTDMDIDALIAAANTNDTFNLPLEHSQAQYVPDCVGSYFNNRKRSGSSQDSLELALGTSASPPHTPKPLFSGLVTPVVPSSPTPSNDQDDALPSSQQSNDSFVSALSSPTLPQLISKQEALLPNSKDSSPEPFPTTASWAAIVNDMRKTNRKQAKIQRTAKEVEESSSQTFKDIDETDSQVSSQGSSEFQGLCSPVRHRIVKIKTKVVEPVENISLIQKRIEAQPDTI